MNMPDGSSQEREFFRVPVGLTVHYGPDSPGVRQAMAMDSELFAVQSRLETPARQILEEETVGDGIKPILPVLRWLDFKLDLILHHMRTSRMREHFPHSLTTFDISGSGLGLQEGHHLEPAQRILLNFTLPDSPSRPIYAVGEVVRPAGQVEGGQAAGIHFVEISDADRERLIRYVFNKQRQELSRRSSESPA